MRKIRIFIKSIFCIMLVLSVAVFGSMAMIKKNISASYKVLKGEKLEIKSIIPIKVSYKGSVPSQNAVYEVGQTYDVDLKLFGVIPFSQTSVEVIDEMYVTVLGNPFGMKIYTDGVLVIELSSVISGGIEYNPAKKAGLKVGDYIKKVNGEAVTSNEDVSDKIIASNGKELSLEILRNGKTKILKLKPQKSDDGLYHAGFWVRDSSAGIGTLTFYSPAANTLCGLGHGICDDDTGKLLEILSGELVEASIVDVVKGGNGTPGELKGKFGYNIISDISLNSDNGVYGRFSGALNGNSLTQIALKQDVEDGKAQILCTVEGDTPKLYDCEIKKRSTNYRAKTQNLIVSVTDSELISKTGGIVQGMSGSPIIQNGKLIGAVTHVLVDDPTKGYGIFAENMLETARSVEELEEAG